MGSFLHDKANWVTRAGMWKGTGPHAQACGRVHTEARVHIRAHVSTQGTHASRTQGTHAVTHARHVRT